MRGRPIWGAPWHVPEGLTGAGVVVLREDFVGVLAAVGGGGVGLRVGPLGAIVTAG